MDNRLLVALSKQLPERRQVRYFQRIDDRLNRTGSNLHKAELRPVCIFGNKFRIEGNRFRGMKHITQFSELALCGDRLIIQAIAFQAYRFCSLS